MEMQLANVLVCATVDQEHVPALEGAVLLGDRDRRRVSILEDVLLRAAQIQE